MYTTSYLEKSLVARAKSWWHGGLVKVLVGSLMRWSCDGSLGQESWALATFWHQRKRQRENACREVLVKVLCGVLCGLMRCQKKHHRLFRGSVLASPTTG